MSHPKTISPLDAAELVRAGAVLVDVREVDEYAREHIPGARHHPLARLGAETPARQGDDVLIFHCRSGARTQANASHLAAAVDCDAYILEGGIEAWKKAGLATALDRRQPIEVMRQVQIAAGSLVLLGVILGYAVSPLLFLLAGFVGAGLAFAGVTGFCGLARVLQQMPWNRRAGPAFATIERAR
jgi:rhodanese-related sulfurtransferase